MTKTHEITPTAALAQARAAYAAAVAAAEEGDDGAREQLPELRAAVAEAEGRVHDARALDLARQARERREAEERAEFAVRQRGGRAIQCLDELDKRAKRLADQVVVMGQTLDDIRRLQAIARDSGPDLSKERREAFYRLTDSWDEILAGLVAGIAPGLADVDLEFQAKELRRDGRPVPEILAERHRRCVTMLRERVGLSGTDAPEAA